MEKKKVCKEGSWSFLQKDNNIGMGGVGEEQDGCLVCSVRVVKRIVRWLELKDG